MHGDPFYLSVPLLFLPPASNMSREIEQRPLRTGLPLNPTPVLFLKLPFHPVGASAAGVGPKPAQLWSLRGAASRGPLSRASRRRACRDLLLLEGAPRRRTAAGDGNPDSWQEQPESHKAEYFKSPLSPGFLLGVQRCPGGGTRAGEG